jgi:hypothetical protein
MDRSGGKSANESARSRNAAATLKCRTASGGRSVQRVGDNTRGTAGLVAVSLTRAVSAAGSKGDFRFSQWSADREPTVELI